MAIKLKTKVALGGIFLFTLLILVGAVSSYYFNRLSNDTGEIVKDNYETLDYTQEMLKELDALAGKDSVTALKNFDKNLQQQEANITEPGEQEATATLRNNFNLLKQTGNIDSLSPLIRKSISQIMQLNLQAIDKKNQAAQESSRQAKTIITVMLTILNTSSGTRLGIAK